MLATSISSLLLEFDVSQLSVELAVGFHMQFSTSSPASSLPVHETLLRQNKSTLRLEKNRVLGFLKFFFYRNRFVS